MRILLGGKTLVVDLLDFLFYGLLNRKKTERKITRFLNGLGG
jgi:hypothetical protein